MLEHHRTDCAIILEKLLNAPAHPFDDNIKSHLPTKHGLYVIMQKNGSGPVKYLHVGRSHMASEGLRSRVWDQHFWGGGKGAGSDLVDKVAKRQLGLPEGANRENRPKAQAWLSENCLVQWIIVEDDDLRCWAEHYALSILRPIWGQ